jgi:hypothetical protein
MPPRNFPSCILAIKLSTRGSGCRVSTESASAVRGIWNFWCLERSYAVQIGPRSATLLLFAAASWWNRSAMMLTFLSRRSCLTSVQVICEGNNSKKVYLFHLSVPAPAASIAFAVGSFAVIPIAGIPLTGESVYGFVPEGLEASFDSSTRFLPKASQKMLGLVGKLSVMADRAIRPLSSSLSMLDCRFLTLRTSKFILKTCGTMWYPGRPFPCLGTNLDFCFGCYCSRRPEVLNRRSNVFKYSVAPHPRRD